VNGRRVAQLGTLGALLATGCSSSLYQTTTSSHGQTNSAAGSSGASGGSTGGASGESSGGNTSGGRTTGEGTSGTGTSSRPPGCPQDCTLPGHFCDDAGQCVVCLDNTECHSTLQSLCFNDAGPYYGTCVQCLGSNNCQGGEICDTSMSCVPGCVTTEACTGQAPICEPDSGMCVTCLSAAECSAGLVCRQGACTVCTSNFECSQNYANLWVCSPEENCVQCEIDADCPNGEHCIGTGCS
jgi:hypothetical protein